MRRRRRVACLGFLKVRKGSRDAAMVQRCGEIFFTILKIDMISEDPRILSGLFTTQNQNQTDGQERAGLCVARGLVFIGVNS